MKMHSTKIPVALWALLFTAVSSHSWVEQMSVLDDSGTYSGTPGYPRGFVARGAPGFSDDSMTIRYPVTGRSGPNDAANRIIDSDLVCAKTQASPSTQNAEFPPLIAAPGNYVSLRYLENGHVSMPDAQPGKPGGGGLVYVYGTTDSKVNHKLLDVMAWKSESSLSEGRLLAINTYDDGRCHQIRNAQPNDPPPPWRNVSPQRQKDFPNNGELACETNIQIPKDAQESLTLYWVWQWPSLPNQKDASGKSIGIAVGKDEIYTTCMDVKIGAPSKKRAAPPTSAASYKMAGVASPLILKAPANFKDRAANVTLPTDTAFYGPNNPKGIPSAGVQQPGQAPAAPPAGNGQSPKASPTVPVASGKPNYAPSQQAPAAQPVASGAQSGGYGGQSGSGSSNGKKPAGNSPPLPTPPAGIPQAAPAPAPATVTVTVTAPAVEGGCIGAKPLPTGLIGGGDEMI